MDVLQPEMSFNAQFPTTKFALLMSSHHGAINELLAPC
jgi:hypothetical protein